MYSKKYKFLIWCFNFYIIFLTQVEGQSPPTIITPQSMAIQEECGPENWTLAKLHCTATGDLPITYTWKKNGHIISSSFSKTGTLHVNLKQGTNSTGRYQCYATNPWGTATSTGTDLYEIPNIFAGAPFYLGEERKCPNVPVHLQSKVKWFRLSSAQTLRPVMKLSYLEQLGAEELNTSTGHIVGPDGTLYFIIAADEEKWPMSYICGIPLQHCVEVKDISYKIHAYYYVEEGKTQLSPQNFTMHASSDAIVQEGNDASLWCFASLVWGPVFPKVKWEILEPKGLKLIEQLELKNLNMTLVIKNVTKNMPRKYQCIAVIPYRKPFVRSFELVVTSRPRFKIKPSDENVTIGSNVTLTCVASGYPKPSYFWTFNSQEIVRGIDKKLQINELSHDKMGKYGCNISNIYGYDYAEVSVMGFTKKTDELKADDSRLVIRPTAITTHHPEEIFNGETYKPEKVLIVDDNRTTTTTTYFTTTSAVPEFTLDDLTETNAITEIALVSFVAGAILILLVVLLILLGRCVLKKLRNVNRAGLSTSPSEDLQLNLLPPATSKKIMGCVWRSKQPLRLCPQQPLGSGSFGQVFLAESTSTGNTVAVKRIDLYKTLMSCPYQHLNEDDDVGYVTNQLEKLQRETANLDQ